ncbi:MAG: hypothetical protein KF893_17005 [Caldilineaceae bacterium]|nr:hypothetical protein [Caldilineaceae bacterium]
MTKFSSMQYTVPMMMRKLRLDPYLILLLGLTLFALTPLLSPGYFYSAHDGRHSVFFVVMFDEAIRSGVLWPVWAMHHSQGYGYPTFLIQAPLAFYVAEFFALLGMGITHAVKAAWAVAFLISAWGMYALVRRWALTWPRSSGDGAHSEQRAAQAGVLAGLLYVYAPYHLLDIYVRAALAETMLMGVLPWVFWAFDRLIVGGMQPGWQGRLVTAALCYAGLMLTHAFAMLAVTPLLVAFILFRLWIAWRYVADGIQTDRRRWQPLAHRVGLSAVGGIGGILLVAIFVLPLLIEGPLLVQDDWVRDTYAYTRHWVHWGQFFYPFWGYGYSDDPAGAVDGMGFQIGVMLVLAAMTAIYLLVTGQWRERSLPLFLLIATLGLLYLMTPGADWLWRLVPLLSVLQFPWRLLALVVFLLSALGGLTLWQLSRIAQPTHQERQADGVFWLFGLVIIFASVGYSQPSSLEPIEAWREDGRAIFQFERDHLDMFGYTTLVAERFTETPLTAQYEAEEFSNDRLERLGILTGSGVVTDHYSRGHHFGGSVVMETPGVVQIRLYAFPGWQVRLNDEPIDYRLSLPHALMEVDVPAGAHRIDVHMGSTPVRTAGILISGATLLGLIVLLVYSKLSHRLRSPATPPSN